MKTPGVYIVEKSAFPNSVVEVATAVPAFIGYTQFALNGDQSLSMAPWRISSLAEYHQYFGFAAEPAFSIRDVNPGEVASFTLHGPRKQIEQSSSKFIFYSCLRLFFENGGESCYIVSVGDYQVELSADALIESIESLVQEQEPTMLVIPEAVSLSEIEMCSRVQQAMIKHCGSQMRNRVAIVDVYDGFNNRQHPEGDCIAQFRDAIGTGFLDFATAYYPWLDTSIVQDSDLNVDIFTDKEGLKALLYEALNVDQLSDDEAINAQRASNKAEIEKITEKGSDPLSAEQQAERIQLNKTLRTMSPLYGDILNVIRRMLNVLPPSAAMAGVYTLVDGSRGVWKAPANVSLAAVTSPLVTITNDEQEDLNVTSRGKSINAIRRFAGKGTLVWGARTLDGNSQEYRYISVRRTLIMLEQSIRLSMEAYVFEPNTAHTWVSVRNMISNFLTGIWRRGGLVGSKPEDAFSVQIGLDETMSREDIRNGILRITVFVALMRPAEFIAIKLTQQLQQS